MVLPCSPLERRRGTYKLGRHTLQVNFTIRNELHMQTFTRDCSLGCAVYVLLCFQLQAVHELVRCYIQGHLIRLGRIRYLCPCAASESRVNALVYIQRRLWHCRQRRPTALTSRVGFELEAWSLNDLTWMTWSSSWTWTTRKATSMWPKKCDTSFACYFPSKYLHLISIADFHDHDEVVPWRSGIMPVRRDIRENQITSVVLSSTSKWTRPRRLRGLRY